MKIKFNDEVKQKAYDYVWSRVVSAERELQEHDSLNYALVDQELLDMMLERKKVNLSMFQYMLKKVSE